MNALDDILARLNGLPEVERKEVIQAAERATAHLKFVPNPGPQTDAYFCEADELFYGGQAGGGKTELLLGLALNEHTVSRIFRRQHNDRQALVDRLGEILGTRDGYNGSDHIWRVPGTDKVIRFGAMSEPDAWQRYQGDPTDLKGWDELTQFREMEYRTVNAWLRTTKPGQRCRIVGAGNPPVTPEGLWVVEYWAPWLDPRHANPARPGELRWFTQVDGKDVEVDRGWRGRDANGLEIKPRSRTFIAASLADNPDLADTGYASALAALPKHLRDAFAEGKFQTAFEDDAWQIIPTEWVLAAQQRWQQRRHEDRGPMTSLGADVAMGGKDRIVGVPVYGNFVDEPVIREGVECKNPRAVAGVFFGIMKDNPQVNMDCTGGWGAGPAEHLESNGVQVVQCVFSAGSHKRTRDNLFKFANKRAEYWWGAREALDPDKGDDIALPPGREVIAELTAARYRIRNRTEIIVEEKAEIEKRIGRSPDIGDGIVLALSEVGATQATRMYEPPAGEWGGAFDRLRSREGGRVNLGYGRTSGASWGSKKKW